jgi:hypothetical protein
MPSRPSFSSPQSPLPHTPWFPLATPPLATPPLDSTTPLSPLPPPTSPLPEPAPAPELAHAPEPVPVLEPAPTFETTSAQLPGDLPSQTSPASPLSAALLPSTAPLLLATIPPAPQMSGKLPVHPEQVLCRECRQNSHYVRYSRCSQCHQYPVHLFPRTRDPNGFYYD